MAEEKTEPKTEQKKSTTTRGKIGGTISLGENVVATIAGLAARDIEGIRTLGRSRMIRFGDSPTRGVEAEVGDTQAAVDVDVVIEYGCDIQALAETLRGRVAAEVARMCDRDVIEVNINVVDIELPEDAKPEPTPRVR